MAEYSAGIRIGGDATGAVEATKEVVDEQKRLQGELGKTAAQAKKNAEESRRFVDGLKEQAATVGKTRVESERYRASQLQLTDAQKQSVDASLKQIAAYEKKQQSLQFVRRAATAAAAAIAAIGAAALVATKSAVDQADQLHKLSQSYGIATEALSAYRFQMRLAGVSNEEFSMAMRTLAKNISEARAGVGVGSALIGALGKDVESAVKSGASLESLLPMIAESFTGWADGANKAALAGQLFGTRVGEVMVPALNQGAAGMREAREEAQRMGLIMGPEFARRSEEFNDNLTRLGANADALAISLGERLVPALNSVLEAYLKGARESGAPRGIWEALKSTAASLPPIAVGPLPLLQYYARLEQRGGEDLRALQAAMGGFATARSPGLPDAPPLPQAGASVADDVRALQVEAAAAYAAALRDVTLGEEEQLATRVRVEDSTERLASVTRVLLDAELAYAAALRDANLGEEEQLATRVQSVDEITELARAREQARDSFARAQDETTRLLGEQAREASRAWERTAENIERSLTDAIMRGGQSGLELLKAAFRTAVLTPIISPLVRPVAQGMSSLVSGATSGLFGAGSMFAGGSAYGAASGGLTSSALASEAAGLGIVGTGAFGGVGAAAAIPGWGWALGGLAIAGGLGLFGRKKRPPSYYGALGAAGINAGGEDLLAQRLQLEGGRLNEVNAALLSQRYSGGADQVAAARLQTVASVLGRSIEDLTRVMSMSAQEWQRFVEQGRQSLAAFARELPGQLGITGLEQFQQSLAVSPFHSPTDRLAAARSQYEDALERARGGDLDAARGLPGVSQQLLGIGRDYYASGTQFQELYGSVQSAVADVLGRQYALRDELIADLPAVIMETSKDQVSAIREMKAALVHEFQDVILELRKLQQ